MRVVLLNPPKKRKIHRAFNAHIPPRSTDIERVEQERRLQRDRNWIKKGAPK